MTGLCFYGKDMVEGAAEVKRSGRGELEMSDVHRHYLDRGNLYVECLRRGLAWFDAGTRDSLVEASTFVQMLERQGERMPVLGEVAFLNGWVDRERLADLARDLGDNSDRDYLLRPARD